MTDVPDKKNGKGSDGIAAELQVKAFTLYKAGVSQRQIAQQLDRSPTRINNYIRYELERLGRERTELGNYVLDLELRRLDDITQALLPRAQKGELLAIDRLLRVMERRAKYLGLDKPAKLEHSGTLSLEHIVAGSSQGDAPRPEPIEIESDVDPEPVSG